MGRFENIKNIESARGIENKSTIGRLLPSFVLTLSEQKPMMGFMNAFQMAPNAMMLPAVPGLISATVVKKNIKNEPTIL